MRFVTLALLALVLVLGGCGKKGYPSPPGPPDKVIFPHTYPSS
jgi:predicted small lipoprotein YifL